MELFGNRSFNLMRCGWLGRLWRLSGVGGEGSSLRVDMCGGGSGHEVFRLVARLEEASLRQKTKLQWFIYGYEFWEDSLTVHDKVAGVAVEFFRGILGSQPMRYKDLTVQFGDIVQFNWSEKGVEALGRPVSRDEIQKALFSMKSGKATRPDEFSMYFYRAAWSLVGDDFCDTELVEGYKESRENPRCVLKVNLQKAYDLVNWDFLFGVLLAIDFPLQFVSWVTACVTSPMFSVMINSSLEGFFPGRKGFQDQCEHIGLTHLVFADDLMIFCAAERDSLEFVRQVLTDFVGLSGFVSKFGKSSMFVASVEPDEAEELVVFMGFSLGSLPITYLGLLLLVGRLRVVDCMPLI
ncbi:uncharacterized protein LOC120073552 [Benincasa hispida]|uniref:uncharacterized protein LOC120073552 n=1 Tax=Benincasa hispida TaxID=102211 RepID=UPI001901612A|nr:uncharacterized protein LOC120073552 [Benincasa hispida]